MNATAAAAAAARVELGCRQCEKVQSQLPGEDAAAAAAVSNQQRWQRRRRRRRRRQRRTAVSEVQVRYG